MGGVCCILVYIGLTACLPCPQCLPPHAECGQQHVVVRRWASCFASHSSACRACLKAEHPNTKLQEGCHLCDGLKDKLEALLERAAFMPSAFRWAM